MSINCHSYYSLKYGTLSVKALLADAQAKGHTQIALTDINNTSAAIDFVRIAAEYNIRPIVGIDFRNGVEQCFVALAINNQGFEEQNAYLSTFLTQDPDPIPARAPHFKHSLVVYPYPYQAHQTLRENEFIGVAPWQIASFRLDKQPPAPHKCVALNTATFRHKQDFNTHRLLRAIDQNTLLSKLPKCQEGNPNQILHSETQLLQAYQGFEYMVHHANALLNQCSIAFTINQDGVNHNQQCYTHNPELDFRLMRKLCIAGLKYRYGENPHPDILARMESEMITIRQKGFVSYFLISWKIVKYARSKGYFYVGRGSGANSIVSYLLRITDVDPIELNLYFERFINLFRKNPPDFDIDFSWQDRQDVTAYIFKRFPHVTLLGAYITFQYRAVFRELGKVFGLPADEISKLQRNPQQADEMGKLVIKYSELIHGFPSHLSVHAAGILISEQPIHAFTATFVPPKGFPTTHFDMIVAEDVGLYKWDILGQRGLAKIKDALKLIRENRPNLPPLDIHDIKRFIADEAVKNLLRNAKAIGCFYVESPAMRMLLAKLQVDNYLGLVAASSVIRPGVSKSGMMREFIQRYRLPERRKDAHPVMLKIMPDTYGVMVYQEDVIKVAHHFAGLSLAEADVLRRGMSGKYRSRDEFLQVQEKFFSNCQQKGYAESLSKEIWRQIESFAGYAFAKGHSASYAVESYQCLFLKAYYPLEYMVATINNGGGFYSREHYLHEARMCGATVHAPCVNLSQARATLYGKDIYLGFAFIQGLEEKTAIKILAARNAQGPFLHLRDFVDRTDISLEQLQLLIRVGAFAFCNPSKKELLWDAHLLLGHKPNPAHVEGNLFKVEAKQYELPKLYAHPLEDAFEQIELLGFPLCSPFELLKELPPYVQMAADIPDYNGKFITLLGYLVTLKPTTASNGQRMFFGNFIDQEGEYIDTVHFPPSLKQHPFQGPGCYWIYGKVTEDFGVYAVEVSQLKRLAYIEDPRYASLSTSKRIKLSGKVDKDLLV